VDWVKEGYQSVPARVQFPAGRRPAAYGPVTVSGLDDPWSRDSPAARRQRFHVGTDGVVSNQQVTGTTPYHSSDGRVVLATPAEPMGDVAYKVKATR